MLILRNFCKKKLYFILEKLYFNLKKKLYFIQNVPLLVITFFHFSGNKWISWWEKCLFFEAIHSWSHFFISSYIL